jgi:hypothetical protein
MLCVNCAARTAASSRPPAKVSFQGPAEAFLQRHLEGAQQTLRHAVAPATQAAYRTGWHRWTQFVTQAVRQPRPADYLPRHFEYAEMQRWLLAFAHFLHTDLGLTPQSVQQSLTGLRHEFRTHLIDVAAFGDPLLSAEMQGIRRTTDHPTATRGPRVPFTLDMVMSFTDYKLTHPTTGPRMCATAALLGYFCLMRSSEYCVSSTSDHTLRAADVEFEVFDNRTSTTHMVPAHRVGAYQFEQVRAVRIVSQTAKNRQDGLPNPSWFSVVPSSTGLFCLARALFSWAKEAAYGSGTDHFISLPTDTGIRASLGYDTMLEAVKAVGKRFGLDPRLCGTHSLRIGGATTLHAAGATTTTIQQAGGWLAPPVATRYPQRTSGGNDLQLQLLQRVDASQLRDIRMSRMLPPRSQGTHTRPP